MNMNTQPRTQAQTRNDGAKFLRMATLIATLGWCFAVAWWFLHKDQEVKGTHRQAELRKDGEYRAYDENLGKTILNPWSGLPGCIYTESMNRTGEMTKSMVLPANRSAGDFNISCRKLGIEGNSRLQFGSAVSQALTNLMKRPVIATPTQSEAESNFVDLPRRGRVARGPDVALTLDVNAQTSAQSVVDCMTGNTEACRRADIDKGKFSSSSFYENARLRNAALIQIDVATGRIEALVSAGSECVQANKKGHSADENGIIVIPLENKKEKILKCPRLFHADPALRADLLDRLNKRKSGTTKPEDGYWEELALEQVWMGSIAKPVQALALLRAGQEWFDPRQRFPGTDKPWMVHALAKSESAEFIDKVLCADKGFPFPCLPLENMFQAARDLGLNRYELRGMLHGQKIESGPDYLRGGLLLQRPTSGRKGEWENLPLLPLDGKQAQACRSDKWSQCRGDYLATLTAELWGQGNTSASLLDAAEMYARLAQAANGMTRAPVPHLVRTEQEGKTVQTTDAFTDLEIRQGHAKDILTALSGTHLFGTTARECHVVYGSHKNCSRLDLAMKTGTPGFAHKVPLNQRFASCRRTHNRQQLAACLIRPIKWAVMVTRNNGKYDKVIVVLGERNWHHSNGLVDGGNASAITAFHYILLRQQRAPTTTVTAR